MFRVYQSRLISLVSSLKLIHFLTLIINLRKLSTQCQRVHTSYFTVTEITVVDTHNTGRLLYFNPTQITLDKTEIINL